MWELETLQSAAAKSPTPTKHLRTAAGSEESRRERSTMHTGSLYPRFSDAEFSRRYTDIRAGMHQAGLSTLLVYGTTGSHHEVQYLSNFPVTREAILVFPGSGEPTLFVQMFNHVPNARQVSCITDVRWGGPATVDAVTENLQERGLAESSIGLVGMLPFQQYASIRRALPRAALVDFTVPVQQLRLVKSDEEIEFLRQG